MAVNKEKYQKIVGVIIDKLEGGYYHPDMLKDGRIKDSRYSNSGETMFGIDRKAGGTLNTSDAGIKFWNIIDKSGARKNWDWLYRGGSLEPKLKDAAADIMYNQYSVLADKYLSPEAKKIVESDDRLLFNFIYATWNGSGWFRKFAIDFNSAVSKGIKNKDELIKIAIGSRIKDSNSLIRGGGNKIALFINNLKNTSAETISQNAQETVEKTNEFVHKNWLSITLISVGIVGLIYFTLIYKGKSLNQKFQLT